MFTFTRLPQLRIAVNSRCGRACFYCRPSGEAISTGPWEELRPNDVIEVCRAANQLGIGEVKLTGGDPALWTPLVDCVTRLKREIKIPSVHVISRHPKIGDLATSLATAGVDLINISLDTLDPEVHREITGRADLEPLVAAIGQCVETGTPCKINMVVMKGVNDDEIEAMIDFCEETGVASLKLLDMIQDLQHGSETHAGRLLRKRTCTPRDLYVSLDSILQNLRPRAVEIQAIHQGGLGHPMTMLRLPSGLQVILKDHQIGAWYGSICDGCRFYPCHDALMALRLTADMRLQFCLLREDATIDLKRHFIAGRDSLVNAIAQAISVYDSARFHKDMGKADSATRNANANTWNQFPVLNTGGDAR